MTKPLREVIRHPRRFLVRVLKGFRANQGILLAGAVAYYTLLSVVPLFTLLLVALSHVVDQSQLLTTLTRYLELVVPGESPALIAQMENFLENRQVVGWVLGGILLFFSSMAFSIVENALSVIFYHRVAIHHRHFLTSVLLPYLFILLLGIGFLVVTLMASALQAMREAELVFFGFHWSLSWLSILLLYLIGLGGQILMLTSIYMVMPVGRISWRNALAGGVVAGLLWEITRHILVWYFSTLSVVGVVYGSLTTTIVALLTLEVAAIILLLGAQVIAEFERLSHDGSLAEDEPVEPMHT